MVVDFVGRRRELEQLAAHLSRVQRDGAGVLLSVRGRRQVGKSRLAEEFLLRSDVPSAFFAATRGATSVDEVAAFVDVVASSTLEAAQVLRDARPHGWAEALRLVAGATTRPSVLVVDELPYLMAGDPGLEGALQQVWDRTLSRVPLLLVVVGSDLSVMELLSTYDRPLYGRPREMRIDPLGVADTARLLHLDAADAVEAMLVTGGLPRLLQEWQPGTTRERFLAEQLSDATSPLLVIGERVLVAELPGELQARRVLDAIGSGEAAYGAIAQRAGVPQQSLVRTLKVLTADKRLVRRDRPLSIKASRLTRYTVADPYLRFWLRFLGPGLDTVQRGRGDLVSAQIGRQWSDYRGAAVEPVLRDLLAQRLPDERFGTGEKVGKWWDRSAEVDLVIADRVDAPSVVTAVGSVKWRESAPFGSDDERAAQQQQAVVPGADRAVTFGVSRSGAAADVAIPVLTPHELVFPDELETYP